MDASANFTIDRLDHVPSYDDFLAHYLLPNRPCILPQGLIRDWEAAGWASAASSSSSSAAGQPGTLHPAFRLLAERYADHIVPVVITRCGPGDDDDDDDDDEDARTSRQEMSLPAAIALMEEAAHDNASPGGNPNGVDRRLVYIKDWHLVRQERQLHRARRQQCDTEEGAESTDGSSRCVLPYTTPDIFWDDWMNPEGGSSSDGDDGDGTSVAGPCEVPDDFRFCYAGIAGTHTGLHRDVYTSYSWSTNVVGRKRWVLYSPALSPLLRRKTGRGPRLTADEAAVLSHRLASGRECATVEQEAGETIFVPSDCFHEVHNLTDAISLNHNWCNSVNLPRMYASMKQEMGEVKEALSDVEDMLRHGGGGGGITTSEERGGTEEVEGRGPWQCEYWRLVQLVSRSDAGWDWRQFWDMVAVWLRQRRGHGGVCASASTKERLHPDLAAFVVPRVGSLVRDFRRLEERQWLDKDTLAAHAVCEQLCEAYRAEKQ
ncbi:unnamed protein product [Parajaminaea phylloscopi]